MPKLKLNSKFNAVNSDSVTQRFNFIQNTVLKSNVIHTFQYVVFLVILEGEFDLKSTAKHMIYKDMIIHSASIVECLIHYKLQRMIDEGHLEDNNLGIDLTTYKNVKRVHKLSITEDIVTARMVKSFKSIKDNLNFVELNQCAKRIGLFDSKFFKISEEIRMLRNKIHMYTLQSEDVTYDKSSMDDFFKKLQELLKVIE